jgi:hypothetical protein
MLVGGGEPYSVQVQPRFVRELVGRDPTLTYRKPSRGNARGHYSASDAYSARMAKSQCPIRPNKDGEPGAALATRGAKSRQRSHSDVSER